MLLVYLCGPTPLRGSNILSVLCVDVLVLLYFPSLATQKTNKQKIAEKNMIGILYHLERTDPVAIRSFIYKFNINTKRANLHCLILKLCAIKCTSVQNVPVYRMWD